MKNQTMPEVISQDFQGQKITIGSYLYSFRFSEFVRVAALVECGPSLCVVIEHEEAFDRILNTDEAKESEKRNQSFLSMIGDICESFKSWKEGKPIRLSVYHFSFLERVGAIDIDPEVKRSAFKAAKDKIVLQLKSEKEGEATIIGRQTKEKQIADILSGANDKSGRQARIAVCAILQDWFACLDRKPIDPKALHELLYFHYAEHEEELCRVRFVVTLTSEAGNQRLSKPLVRPELEELLSKIDGKISSIKISLK